MEPNQILDFTATSFDAEVLGAGRPVLVDFSADWCPPCRMIEPIVAEAAGTYAGRLTVGRLDVERDPEVGIRYGVLGMPTLIMFAGGVPVDRLVGFSSPGHVRRWVAETMAAAAAR